MESQLQAVIRLYNTEVTSYNQIVALFPSSLFASLFGFNQAKLFELENDIEKENIQITFKNND